MLRQIRKPNAKIRRKSENRMTKAGLGIPKVEFRSPKEARRPKSETRLAATARQRGEKNSETRSSTKTAPSALAYFELRDAGFFRISEFGIRVSPFGGLYLRASQSTNP